MFPDHFNMAFKIVLLVASMAVASQASNTLWACRKFNFQVAIRLSCFRIKIFKVEKAIFLSQSHFLLSAMQSLSGSCVYYLISIEACQFSSDLPNKGQFFVVK